MLKVWNRGSVMGKVATVFKVYAEDISQTDSIKAQISSTLKPTGIQVDDIGFGIRVIKVMFVHEDKEGSTSYEEGLRKVKGVRDVEVDDETLI
jgi:translation elongation factor EF-1beta